jgi:hypothetical protein
MGDDRTAEKLFHGKPVQLRLYHHVREFIASLGPVTIDVLKTQVSFGRKRKFAWVWLPMDWDKRRPPTSIVVSFSLGERINDPRIAQVVELAPGRWMHHVIIEMESDLSEDVKGWLKQAFGFAAPRGNAPGSSEAQWPPDDLALAQGES